MGPEAWSYWAEIGQGFIGAIRLLVTGDPETWVIIRQSLLISISATLASVSGSTGLAVSPGPLMITTTSLSDATVDASYTATLGATGGTPPYPWSITSGTLPAELSLEAQALRNGTEPATAATVLRFHAPVHRCSDSTAPAAKD